MKKRFFLFLVYFGILANTNAQERLKPLQFNPEVEEGSQIVNAKRATMRSTAAGDTLLVPFIDDFSKPGPFPDNALWKDHYVFVNSAFAMNPPSIGAATFDALNDYGYPYNFINPSAHGVADSLTSRPIKLFFQPIDSVYLSFFYQAQGLGNAPQPIDSLILEFKSSNGSWYKVWGAKGEPISSDSSFKRVNIPILSSTYLYNGFQFRFKNKATLSGNVDHWNLDYIYLNKNRTLNDGLEDVTFIKPAKTILNNEFTAVPWKHYSTSMMGTDMHVEILNRHSGIKSVTYNYAITDRNYTVLYTNNSGTDPFDAGVVNSCSTCGVLTNPSLNGYTYPVLNDCMEFVTKHIISSMPDMNRNNDTVRYLQQFTDYYAYDDGSAEAAYGLQQIGGMIAYKFTTTTKDTLKAIKIYFSPDVNDVSSKRFKLTVFSHDFLTNQPGTILSQNVAVSNPTYTAGMQKFALYTLETPVEVEGPFYIGWEQLDIDELNIGFDRNNNSKSKMYYKLSDTWYNTTFTGSWMMRPIFSSCKNFNPTTITEIENREKSFVSPNPAFDQIEVNINPGEQSELKVYDMSGKCLMVRQINTSERVSVSEWAEGLYLVQCINRTNGVVHQQKIMIQK